jgi:peptidoglycan hydrolase CwlO-like protein
MELMEKNIREEYQIKLAGLEQELQLAHKEIEDLRQERQQAWPTPETILTPTKPYLKRSSGVMEMVPRAELTDAVYARELAEARLRDVQAESKELQECVTECATMIEELSGQQQALEAAIEERTEQIDTLMNRCMVAEFRVNEVDELVNERDQLRKQLSMTRKELQHYQVSEQLVN